jgi:vesicle coat complex subunit
MSYIPLPVVISALIDPLRHCLRDQDPYVRKTAALCVAKLYMHDPRVVDKQGFIGMLRDLLADSNPTVVANGVAALTEISERSSEISLRLNLTVANKLIAALGECSEYVNACFSSRIEYQCSSGTSAVLDGDRFISSTAFSRSFLRIRRMLKFSLNEFQYDFNTLILRWCSRPSKFYFIS